MSELIQNRGRTGLLNPKHPERICWGCDKFCPADDLRCGNGTIRTQHPAEIFGQDWLSWELDQHAPELQNDDDSGVAQLPEPNYSEHHQVGEQ